jgi:hypothetical protein
MVLSLVLAGALVLGVAAGLPRIEPSDASWTDSEVASGSLSALTIDPPTILSCTASTLGGGGLGLGPSVTVTWSFPTGHGYSTPNNIAYATGTAGLGNLTNVALGNGVATSGPSGGVYTTKYDGAALSGLLSSQFRIALSTVDGSGWTSKPVSYLASIGLLGLGTTCDPDA